MNETKELLGKLRRLTNLMQSARTQEFANHDFNMMDGKGRLLSVLYKKDGLTQRELGQALNIRPSSVGELLRKLETNALVIRKNNEIDRRVMNVYLTDAGREIVSSVASSQEEIQANVFKEISEEEKEKFAQVLEKMIISLEDEYPAESQDQGLTEFGRQNCRGGKGRSGRGNRGNDARIHCQQGNGNGLGRRRNQNNK